MTVNKCKLDDVTELVIDYRGKTPKKLGGYWSDEGYRALSAKNIKNGEIIREDTIRFLDKDLYKKWMKIEINPKDILITSEAPFGEIYFWDSNEKIVLSQRLFAIRPDKNKILPEYLYFYMSSDEFQWELLSRSTGTTVTGLRQPELLKCSVKLPSIETQIKIAEILMNITKKIENNKKINNNFYARNIFF